MKKIKMLMTVSAIIMTIACSNSEQKPSETPDGTPTASELMKEEPPYDPAKIDPNAPVTTITIHAQGTSMADMQYDLKEIKVKSGCTVKLELINDCTDPSMIHNLVLVENGTIDSVAMAGIKAGLEKNYVPDMKEVLVSTNMLQPKTKTEISFPAPEKGTYDFFCSYPGHSMRMNGKFIVE